MSEPTEPLFVDARTVAFNEDVEIVTGADVLAAIVLAGIGVHVKVIRGVKKGTRVFVIGDGDGAAIIA